MDRASIGLSRAVIECHLPSPLCVKWCLRARTKNRGHFPNDIAVAKLLWLAICNIEDKRARDRAKERGRPANERRAAGRLVEGQITTNWKQALEQLVLAY